MQWIMYYFDFLLILSNAPVFKLYYYHTLFFIVAAKQIIFLIIIIFLLTISDVIIIIVKELLTMKSRKRKYESWMKLNTTMRRVLSFSRVLFITAAYA